MGERQPEGEQQLRLPTFDGGIDLGALRKQREELLLADRARLTVSGYQADLRVFARWCGEVGRSPLPCSSETLSLYVTWLLNEGKRRISSVSRHLSAIIDSHRRSGHPIPSTSEARETMAGAQRQRRETPRGKSALSPRELIAVARACDGRTNLGTRDRAIVVLGFATSLRRTFEKRGMAVLVARSKTDQRGKTRLVGVWAGKRACTDPVRTLRAWIARRGAWTGPLFPRIHRHDRISTKAIAPESINDTVKRAIERAGIDASRYGAHSLRAGAATASAELGRSDQEIMSLTGHKSAKVMQMYIRRSRVFSGRNPLEGLL